jgi:hypothetical protein
LISVLKRLLARETCWIAWKSASCTSFERHGFDPLALESIAHGNAKRKKISSSRPYDKKNRFEFDISDSNVKENAKFLVESIPTVDRQLQVNYILFALFY